MQIERVAVCGLGKLGACVAAVLAASQFEVIGYDTDPAKLQMIRDGKPPVDEPGLESYYKLYNIRRVNTTDSVEELVRNSDCCIFVLPTPSKPDGSFDDKYLMAAALVIKNEVAFQGKRDYLFIVSSTTSPGQCQRLKECIGEYNLCYKPEFIALGTVLSDMKSPDFVLIGESSKQAGDAAEGIYRRVVDTSTVIKRMSLVEAELAKIALNCAITMKISFANQVGLVARKYGADANKILEAVGLDKRVGSRCLLPGLPFGGPCFPRDNRAFSHLNIHAVLARATDEVNRVTKFSILEEVLSAARYIPGNGSKSKVGILGTAYKAGTSVTDESIGLFLEEELRIRNFQVFTHDPVAPHNSTLDEVVTCPVIVVCCAHPEYKTLVVGVSKNVVDPSNILPKMRLHETHTVTTSH